MGQVLNVEIVNAEGEALATGYYHWSGYLVSTMNLALTMAKFLKEADDLTGAELTETDRAVLLLMSTGAKMDKEEYHDYLTIDPGREFTLTVEEFATNRNDGLISINPEGMAKTKEAAQAVLIFYMEEQKFDLSSLLWHHDSIQEMIDFQEIDASTPEKVAQFQEGLTTLPAHLDFVSTPLEQLEELNAFVQEVSSKRACFEADGEYYSFSM